MWCGVVGEIVMVMKFIGENVVVVVMKLWGMNGGESELMRSSTLVVSFWGVCGNGVIRRLWW